MLVSMLRKGFLLCAMWSVGALVGLAVSQPAVGQTGCGLQMCTAGGCTATTNMWKCEIDPGTGVCTTQECDDPGSNCGRLHCTE